MFLKLQSNKMLNMRYLQDVSQGFHDKNVVVIYLTNGGKFIEKYATANEAEQRIEQIREIMSTFGTLCQKDTYADLPEEGVKGTIYITKDTGQTYYWDYKTKTYITTGIAGRTGVYVYDGELSKNIGATQKLKKSDLLQIIAPTVDYMNGCEIIAKWNVHGIIIDSDKNNVIVKTILDLIIDSFIQVEKESDLPSVGSHESLYFVKENNQLKSYDNTESRYISYYPTEDVDNEVIRLDNRIDKEINDRQDEVSRLDNRVDKEIKDRRDEVTRLDGRIDSEASIRLNADNSLSTRINNEASARSSADISLGKRIDKEIENRQSEDETLQEEIDSLIERVKHLEAIHREEENIMDILNEINGTDYEYTGSGGTNKQIKRVLLQVLGGESIMNTLNEINGTSLEFTGIGNSIENVKGTLSQVLGKEI